MRNNNSKRAVAVGIIAAIMASSCCIPPFIVAIAGVSSMAGSLSWMEPLRPYLIGVAIIAISYAWYVNLKTKTSDHCGCDIEKPKWYQTKAFLVGMTFFTVVSITFPYYSGIFFTKNQQTKPTATSQYIQKINMHIEGMTCDACQHHINSAVGKLAGIINVESSYEKGNAIVEFDNTKTNISEIEKAINSTGYKIVENE